MTGLAINGGGYLLFLLFLSIGVEHKFAATILYVVGVLISFLLNRKFVFNSKTPLTSSLIKHVAMVLGGYILNIAMLSICVDRYGYSAKYIQLISVGIVSLYFYFFSKFVVHSDRLES
jgi:putative flippase GtrA